MEQRIVELTSKGWQYTPVIGSTDPIAELEAGKVLYIPDMPFELSLQEQTFLTPSSLDPSARNISLDAAGKLKGARLDSNSQRHFKDMLNRFRERARGLIHSLAPQYCDGLRLAPTSFRPTQVEARVQSLRADDRRIHIDAFPSRPNRGERILRVFANINPHGQARLWQIGEPFEQVARRFVPRAKAFSAWRAKLLHQVHVTKSLRSEYDHLMLQIHDGMKADDDYQRNVKKITMAFPAGSVWICFSDQASHAVLSGQYMMEQTFHLPPEQQYNQQSHPLAILRRLTGRNLT